MSSALGNAARVSAKELRQERLEMAQVARQPVPGRRSPRRSGDGKVGELDLGTEASRRSAATKDAITGDRVGRASANTKRNQARKDRRN